MALSRLCCATLDMMLGGGGGGDGTLQTVLCYTRYDAGGVYFPRLCCATLDMMLGVWYSPDCALLH